jgi:hypothetical protein
MGEQLGLVTSKTNGRPAFDLVFRPVKSVSILWALGDERVQQAVRQAHDIAVREALKGLEADVGTRRDQAETALREAERRAHETAQARKTAQTGRRWVKGGQNAREAQEAAERAAKDLEAVRAAADRAREQAVTRELATRKQLGARALELNPPAWLEAEIGRPWWSGDWTGGRRGGTRPSGSTPTGAGTGSPIRSGRSVKCRRIRSAGACGSGCRMPSARRGMRSRRRRSSASTVTAASTMPRPGWWPGAGAEPRAERGDG